MKRILVLALALCLATTAAWGETYLYTRHVSQAHLVNNKANYDDAGFGFIAMEVQDDDTVATEELMELTGTMTVENGRFSYYKNPNRAKKRTVRGASTTFALSPAKENMELGEAYLEYVPAWDASMGTSGEIDFLDEANTGLNGATVSWRFPDMPDMDGSGTVPTYLSTAGQVASRVPYIEVTTDDAGNITNYTWRIVSPANTAAALTLPFNTNVRVRCMRSGQEGKERWMREGFSAGTPLGGTATPPSPVVLSEVVWLEVRYIDGTDPQGDRGYFWRFWPKRTVSAEDISSDALEDVGIETGEVWELTENQAAAAQESSATSEELSESYAEYVDEGQEIAITMNPVNASTEDGGVSGALLWEVDADTKAKIAALTDQGETLQYILKPVAAETNSEGTVRAKADGTSYGVLLVGTGSASHVLEDGEVYNGTDSLKVLANIESGTSYAQFVTKAKTISNSGGSSSGCNAGLGALALLALTGLLRRR